MKKTGQTHSGWAWLMIVLAGVCPFALHMSRNFQMFTPKQLAWSLGAIVLATSSAFALTWLILQPMDALSKRLGRPLGTRPARILYALVAAGVLSIFLFGSNVMELRYGFELSKPATALVILVLFLVYWGAALRTGPKWACALLAGVTVFSLMQASWAAFRALPRRDALVPPEHIRIYERVTLKHTPNIYYICLESYHGFDAMKKLYDFDNMEFHDFLSQNHFTTENGILANYSFTMSSIQSFFQMGHHYGAGYFGNHDSLYTRGFVSGSKNYYNPVLHILKNNGYSIVYLLPSDYYYRPGSGAVDQSLLTHSWPFAPLSVTLPYLIQYSQTDVSDYELKLSNAIATWPLDKPAFFFIKLGAEHVPYRYDFRTHRTQFVAHFVKVIQDSNEKVAALCRQIIAKDPAGIIILAGDHGAQSYRPAHDQSWQETIREANISNLELVQDIHDVLLAIRWGEAKTPAPYPYKSLVNVMRFVFFQLGADKLILETAAQDDSYCRDGGGRMFYQTVQDGQPLEEWQPVSTSSR